MRRSPLHRIVAALFAVWIAVVIGDPGVLHSCPEHGAHALTAAHGSHSAHHDAGHQHGSKSHGGCTCVGSCCVTAAVGPLPTVATFAVATHIVPAVEQPRIGSDVAFTSPDRLLPFANGPPQA